MNSHHLSRFKQPLKIKLDGGQVGGVGGGSGRVDAGIWVIMPAVIFLACGIRIKVRTCSYDTF
jgi:hypothetical protein